MCFIQNYVLVVQLKISVERKKAPGKQYLYRLKNGLQKTIILRKYYCF